MCSSLEWEAYHYLLQHAQGPECPLDWTLAQSLTNLFLRLCLLLPQPGLAPPPTTFFLHPPQPVVLLLAGWAIYVSGLQLVSFPHSGSLHLGLSPLSSTPCHHDASALAL